MTLALVTGASSGIGFATATALLDQGWSVILLAPSQEKAEQACVAAKATTTRGEPHALGADLSAMSNVIAAARNYKSRFGPLDVLINNAGINAQKRVETVDGIESNFAVNYMAPFLLTNLLLEPLLASGHGRIVNVSSIVERKAHVDLSDLDTRRHWSSFRAYGRSKQALILFTIELARRLGQGGITVNALHPGVIGTDMFREMPLPVRWLSKALLPGPQTGALTSVYLASSPDVASVTGSFFIKSRIAEASKEATDPVRARALWDATVGLLENIGLSRGSIEHAVWRGSAA